MRCAEMRWLLRRAAKVDLACFRKPRKRTASRVTALVLHGVVKAVGKGTEKDDETLKVRATLKAVSFSRAGTIGRILDNRGHSRVLRVSTYLHKGSFA